MTPARRDLVVALSLANLTLVRAWQRLVFATPFTMPLWTWRDLLAAVVNLLCLSVLFRACIASARRPGWQRLHLDRWMFLLPATVFAAFLYTQFPHQVEYFATQPEPQVAAALCAGAALLLLVRRPETMFGSLRALALLLSPFVALTLSQAAWVVTHQPQAPRLAERLPGAAQHRVVWVVFDEMDWRPVFSARSPGLELPELDRLRTASVYVQSTYEAGTLTSLALPSMLAGRTLYGISPEGPSRMRVTRPDGVEEPLEAGTSVFDDARRGGLNAAAAGWWLPYCRLFASALTRCYWEAMDTRVGAQGPDLLISLLEQWRTLSPLYDRRNHIRRYEAFLREAPAMAADRSLGFVLLHLPAPHEPAIYDRRSGRLTALNFRPDWYLDNLALSDRMLGEIRGAMERAGVWDDSAVIVTSDHALRWYRGMNETTDPRVPLLIKLPSQTQGLVHTTPFRATGLRELTVALLAGGIQRPEQLSAWLEQRPGPALPPSLRAAGAR